jgi:large subunit ribosomal protein L9
VNVLLRSSVSGLGIRGDVVKVSDGYARNYLLPRGLAVVSSAKMADQAARMRKVSQEKARAEKESAEALAAQIAGATVEVSARASSEGRLFGSVGAQEIAERLAALVEFEIERSQVHLVAPLKETGEHKASVVLHPEVTVEVSVVVTPLAE